MAQLGCRKFRNCPCLSCLSSPSDPVAPGSCLFLPPTPPPSPPVLHQRTCSIRTSGPLTLSNSSHKSQITLTPPRLHSQLLPFHKTGNLQGQHGQRCCQESCRHQGCQGPNCSLSAPPNSPTKQPCQSPGSTQKPRLARADCSGNSAVTLNTSAAPQMSPSET